MKLKNAYNIESGIISKLKAIGNVEGLNNLSDDKVLALDTLMVSSYGNRKLNKIGKLISENSDTLCAIIDTNFSIPWNRLYTSYTAKYNPIWNVDGTETETETHNLKTTNSGTESENISNNGTSSKTGTETTSRTDARSGSDTQTITNNIYAYNSTSATNSDGSTTQVSAGITNTINQTVTPDTTETNSDTGTRSKSDNYENTDTGTITREKTRGGNIGVTMTQQMLEADVEYWTKLTAHFYMVVLHDIADFITIKVY